MHILIFFSLFFHRVTAPSGPEPAHYRVSRSHSDKPQAVEFLWTRDRPDAETSTLQHTTLTRDRHPCRQQDSNPQSQQANIRAATGIGILIHKVKIKQSRYRPVEAQRVAGS